MSSEPDQTIDLGSDPERNERVESLCDRFQSEWMAGGRPSVEDYLSGVPESDRSALERELSLLVAELRRLPGTTALPGVGDTIGNYVLLEKIGQGGMGQVYRARHAQMGRIVALKLLSLGTHERETVRAIRRFRREVRATARLSHTNIVTAHDAGEHAGTPYLVMEFIEGVDLWHLVQRDGPVSIRDAVAMMHQAACGLAYAHAQSIVHRDIKPSNLLRTTDGTVKVLDLGLARIVSGEVVEETLDPHGPDLTQSGTFLGSVDYIAPEQSLDTRAADARSDIYSLGCTLHYLLTGHPPFTGPTTLERLLSHREARIPDLRARRPDTPEALGRLFQRMLAKNPVDRPPGMEAVASELQHILTTLKPEHDLAPAARREEPSKVVLQLNEKTRGPTPFSQPLRVRPAFAVVPIAFFALAFLGLVGSMLWSSRPQTGHVLLMTHQPEIAGAQIYVDGTRVSYIGSLRGELPYGSFDVPAGQHTIRVVKPGFHDFEAPFEVSPGGRWEYPITLFPIKTEESESEGPSRNEAQPSPSVEARFSD